MTQTITHTCAGCSAAFVGSPGELPPGWERTAQGLACGDCLSGQFHQRELPIAAAASTWERCETAVELLSGAYVDLADPDCSVVQPIDIAAGRALGGEKGLQLRRCALMHDAAEAIIHDVTRPLKIQLPDYQRIERLFETRLATAIGWEWTEFRRVTVKRADIAALAIEQRDIKGSTDAWPIFDGLDREALKSITIRRAWQPDEAQDRFLEAYADLFPTEERLAA